MDTPIFRTRAQASAYDRQRLRGLANQARGDQGDLHRAYLDLLTALSNLKACGVKADYDDAARGFHDAISNRDAELRRDIDAEHGEVFCPLIPAEPLDLSDLEDFFGERA